MEPIDEEKHPSASRGSPAERSVERSSSEAGRRGEAPRGSAGAAAARAPRGDVSRRYTAQEKQALLSAYAASGQTMDAFAAAQGVSTASICKWRKAVIAGGVAGLAPKPNARNASGPHRGAFSYTPEQRRAAVEAFLAAGQTLQDFARIWGVSRKALGEWVKLHRAGGPKALEDRPSRSRRATTPRPGGGVGRRLAQPIRDLVARVRERYPYFGLKRIRDFLLRFHAIRISPGGVRSALAASGRAAVLPREQRRRRAPPKVRSFERAEPMELWQTDITSFLLGRNRERAYLTVFLDDRSRYVVSFALHLQQKSELVIEALKDGIARFGRPKEILSDQGRQYFAWRGKSAFERLLRREGIRHVVARAHHPQTLGKCERLWETVKQELLDRVQLQGVEDARRRLQHFFAHYNHFRPHQGIGGLVPADRFFAVETALRAAQEQQLARNELALALEQAPPPAVFLFGQIGEEQVALHGEHGRVVIHTSRGERTELAAEQVERGATRREAAAAVEAREPRGDGEEAVQERWIEAPADESTAPANLATVAQTSKETDDERPELDGDGARRAAGGCADDGRITAADPQLPQAADPRGAADAVAGESPVGGGERGGEAASAQDVRAPAPALAGTAVTGASSAGTRADAAASVAAQPTGGGGDGGGSVEAAQDAAERRADAAGSRPGGGSQAAQGDDRTASERQAGDASPDRSAARAAGESSGEGERAEGAGNRSGGGEGGGGGRRPGTQEEASRDAQIVFRVRLGSESGSGS